MVTKDEILAEKEIYWNTVLFFAAFSEFCTKKKISCLVEYKFIDKKGNPKYPDFSIFNETNKERLKLVFEHKGSLPIDVKKVYEIISETKEKYETLEINSKRFNPRIIMLFPKCCEEVVNKLEKEKTKLEVLVFNLRDEEKLTFVWFMKLPIEDSIINKISESEIPCNEDDFARYKFIRKDPHPTYTAWILKNIIFPRFKTPYNYNKESFKIKLENIYEEAETLFPLWIGTDVKQITRDRIKKGIDFLKFVGFIDLDLSNEEIIFYNQRGIKVGELFEYFAKMWLKYTKPKKKRGKKKILPKEQKTLNDL